MVSTPAEGFSPNPRTPAIPGEMPVPEVVPDSEEPKNYLNVSYGVMSWLFTLDHKRIAMLYLLSVSLMFIVGHNPGALVDALAILKANKVNMTWIESYPSRSAKSEYIFFVDIEGHAEEPKAKKAIAALTAQCDKLSILGSYPMAPLSAD